jgi:hypothetical protein
MARSAIPVYAITRAGIVAPTETTTDVANGNTLPNNGATWLAVRNSNGASTTRTLTVQVSTTVDGQAVTPRPYPVAAGVTRYIGPFPIATYGQNLLLNPDNAELRVIALTLSA